MVAITVILAAVIGTFVLNLGDNQEQNAVAGVDITQDQSDRVTVTVISMDSADSVRVTTSGSFTNPSGFGTDNMVDPNGDDETSVGDSASWDAIEDDTVTVIAELEGKENVIQTYTV
jgi:FlaG/FlaF family flagellin (archaellin)